MIRYSGRLLLILLFIFSRAVFADILLQGNFNIGDKSVDALNPTRMVGYNGAAFVPVEPIHFYLSAPVTLSEIRLEGAGGLNSGMNVVVWDSSNRVVVNAQAGAASPYSVTGQFNLAAGDYRMAVWGSCYYNNAFYSRYYAGCPDWDDFSFSGIRLVSSGSSDAIHLSERTHIGDNYDASRWYPPGPKGIYVKYDINFNKRVRLDTLRMYNIKELSRVNTVRMFIRTKGSVDTPLIYNFTQNGDITWRLDYEVAAGDYELWVETLSNADRDDITWDDIVLSYTVIPVVEDFSSLCNQAFGYPAQGRTVNHEINLGGTVNGTTMGRIRGTNSGQLGYYNRGKIKGSASAACDGRNCLPVANSGALALPPSRFPLPNGTTINVPYGMDRVLTATDGAAFSTISVTNNASLDIRQSGLTIQNLNLYSGRLGKPYTVRLAAGDYWIDSLTMAYDTRIELVGPVRLFVKDLVMFSGGEINSLGYRVAGDVNRLLLVTYGRLTMNAYSTLTGLVYQHEGSYSEINSEAYLMGRISSPKITMGYNSYIDSSSYSCPPQPIRISHYELHYGNKNLTCEAASVELKACVNSACTELYTQGASVTLSPASGWSNNPVTINASGSTALTLRRYQSGSLPLSLSTATPAVPLKCVKAGSEDPTCTIDYVDAALRFNLPTFYAGESASSEIRAIKSSEPGATRVCLPLLTGTQSLRFDYGKVISEPASQTAPVVNGVTVPAAGTAANVTFDGNGVGQLRMQYADAGVLRLDVSVPMSDGTGTLNLRGSDTVAVLPKAIVLQGEGQPACSGSDDAGYASCPVYRKAGENFVLLAQAVNSLNGSTPGFAAKGLSLDWQLLAPVGGARGGVSPQSLSMAAGSGSLDTSWSEVGVFKAGVTNFVPYPAYQDESPQLEVPLRWSTPVGRFVPANFNLLNSNITPFCNDFTYMGQPFGVSFRVQARNVAGGVTQNYQGPFAKGRAIISAANNKDGRSLTNRMRAQSPLPWRLGEAEVSGSSEFVRLADSQPDGPYEAMRFGFAIRDQDGERSLIASPDFNEAVVGDCRGSACNARLMDPVPMALYFGRLLAGTVTGQASAALAISQQLQYYVAGSWQRNRRDECSQLSLANQGFTFLNQSHTFDAATRELNLGAGRKIKLGLGSSAPGGDAALAKDGEILFHFAKPDINVKIPYKVDLAKQPSSPLWLSDPTSLQGEAIFGTSRGNDKIIYRRELLR